MKQADWISTWAKSRGSPSSRISPLTAGATPASRRSSVRVGCLPDEFEERVEDDIATELPVE